MGKSTGIQWTDDTVNCVSGCDGCELAVPGKPGTCYAKALHETRLAKSLPLLYAADFHEVRMIPGRIAKAVRCMDLAGHARPRRKGVDAKPWLDGLRRKIFIGDLSDILSAGVTFEFLKEEMVDAALSAQGARHDYQVLTKRPQRAVEFAHWLLQEHGVEWPGHMWVGTSFTSRTSLSRLDHLVQMPARIRFVSLEPQIEDVDLSPWLTHVQWVIIGGESDQGMPGRPYDVAWARHTIAQCRDAGVVVFVKQLGSAWARSHGSADMHGGNWSGWPQDIRVREMPDRVHATA